MHNICRSESVWGTERRKQVVFVVGVSIDNDGRDAAMYEELPLFENILWIQEAS